MNFREMRRKKQYLTEAECTEVLIRNDTGILAVLGDGGYPYTVPLNYVYTDGKLYFHCGKNGHKIDAIKNCDKVSFCVIDEDEVMPLEYATAFRSVIIFGRAHIEEDDVKKRSAIEKLALKYAPNDTKENRDKEINSDFPGLCMVRIDPEHITGKEASKFVNEKNA